MDRRPLFGVNLSLPEAARKWPSAARRCGGAALLSLWFLALAGEVAPALARKASSPFSELENLFAPPRASRRARAPKIGIPLPQPRPAEAPQKAAEKPPAPATEVLPKPRPVDAPQSSKTPAEAPPVVEIKPEQRPPSACRLALTEDIAIAPSVPDISGPGECGAMDVVRLEAVVLRDATRVPLKPAATLRCEMASAVAAWIRDDIAPMANALGSAPATLDIFDSFDCRGRNRVKGAKVSEHGRGNALDLRGILLKNGMNIALTERAAAREVREKVRQSVCTRFSTVLGPGSDGYHEDHIHLDLAARRSGYRICQWTIDDALPAVAPMLPAARPEEAPPREVAPGKADQNGAVPAGAEPNAKDEAGPEAPPAPTPVKKRLKP